MSPSHGRHWLAEVLVADIDAERLHGIAVNKVEPEAGAVEKQAVAGPQITDRPGTGLFVQTHAMADLHGELAAAQKRPLDVRYANPAALEQPAQDGADLRVPAPGVRLEGRKGVGPTTGAVGPMMFTAVRGFQRPQHAPVARAGVVHRQPVAYKRGGPLDAARYIIRLVEQPPGVFFPNASRTPGCSG